ncbi:MAG: DASH family cryptochrome [Fuerstiella sp.]|nr:DASH family cryptochrome [Fuerstiella sp.]
MSKKSHHVVWFRNNLRIRDNAPLAAAVKRVADGGGQLSLVYIIDPRCHAKTSFGFDRVGAFRNTFLAEALNDFGYRLRNYGLTLTVMKGKPEDLLPKCVGQSGSLYFQREIPPEERAVEISLRQRMLANSVNVHDYCPNTLLDFQDLPFDVANAPEVFTKFRRNVEKNWRVALEETLSDDLLLRAAQHQKPITAESAARSDAFCEQNCKRQIADSRRVMSFVGGESAGLQRLNEYFWERDCLKEYKQTRNGMLGPDYSSKFSPWLSLGCISPRHIYAEIRRYEAERGSNESTYWLIFELLWRDYFAVITAKHGSALFQIGGLRRMALNWEQDWSLFERWQNGTTGYPLIDANMRELQSTGWMSNRGRQNVASFLTKNLGIDWRMGAEWFESQLIDYDACSNYGNWNYTAGVGNDARGFRWFNTIKQSQDYDSEGRYVRHWLPSLKEVPKKFVHTPWQMHVAEQQRSHCVIGTDFPTPIVDLFQSARDIQSKQKQT